MIKRLKTALFAPHEIINMRVDNFGLTFLFVLILAIVMMIPACIKVARFQNVSYDKRIKVQDAFNEKEVPFAIVNSHLVQNSEEKVKDYYVDDQLLITICNGELSKVNNKTQYRIVFSDDSVDLYYYLRGNSIGGIEVIKYSKYQELENINLTLASSNTNYDFWNTMFNVVNKEIKLYIPYVSFGVAIGYSVVNLCMMLLIALVLTLFQRIMIRRIISFKESFTIACYALAPLAVFGLLGQLFGVNFLSTIGVVAAVVYNMIASNQLLSINDRK